METALVVAVSPSSGARPPMDTPIQVDLGRIAQDLQIRKVQVENVVQLLDEGNTVPFITRYRKERTGGLNEEVIRQIEQRAAMPAPGSPIQFAEFIKKEIDTWGEVVRATGTKPGT